MSTLNIAQMSDEQLQAELEKIAHIDELITPYKDYTGPDQVVFAHEIKSKVGIDTAQKFKTTIGKLNEVIDSFKSGDLITVSGISGNGKTELLVSFTKDFMDNGYVPFWVSFEVSPRDFMGRFGDYKLNFVMPQRNKPNDLAWLFDRIKEAKAKYNANIIIIDHLHFLVNFDQMKGGNDSLIFGSVIRKIKSLALELDITIFLIAHVKKVQSDECPDLPDLRDSSFTYQEADTVLFIHRTDKDQEINTKKRYSNAVIRVAKNRWKGSLGLIHVQYDTLERRFYEKR